MILIEILFLLAFPPRNIFSFPPWIMVHDIKNPIDVLPFNFNWIFFFCQPHSKKCRLNSSRHSKWFKPNSFTCDGVFWTSSSYFLLISVTRWAWLWFRSRWQWIRRCEPFSRFLTAFHLVYWYFIAFHLGSRYYIAFHLGSWFFKASCIVSLHLMAAHLVFKALLVRTVTIIWSDFGFSGGHGFQNKSALLHIQVSHIPDHIPDFLSLKCEGYICWQSNIGQ